MCKILILNGCLPESEISKKLELFKNNYKGEYKEVFLYQLNIKATESRDGMDVIYDSILSENMDALLVACETELDKTLELAIARLKSKFVNSELENKIFGAILVGEDFNKELVNIAFDMGMITNANCFATITNENDDSSELEIKNVAETVYDLASMISNNVSASTTQIPAFDEHTDALQEEDPNEMGLDDFGGVNDTDDIYTEEDVIGNSEDENENEDAEQESESESELEEGEEDDEEESSEEELDETFESLKINLVSFSQFNK